MTVDESFRKQEVMSLLHKNRIEKILVINSQFELKGLITVKDIQKADDFPALVKTQMNDFGRRCRRCWRRYIGAN